MQYLSIESVNEIGTSAKQANIDYLYLTEPSKIHDFKELSEERSRAGITLEWQKPDSLGGFLSVEYTVVCSDETQKTIQTFENLNITTLHVPDLEIGNEYRLTVTASNDEGTSQQSDAVEFTFFVSPTAPTNLGKRIEFKYANKLVLEWKAPDNFGGLPNVTYTVYSVEPLLEAATVIASGLTTREFEIMNPMIGFMYQFQVSATNAWGESPLSDVFELVYMTEP